VRVPAESAQPALPASLRGTQVDGTLLLDADGVFRGDAGAIALFDYFLATLGETDLDGVRALVAAEAARRLPGHEAEVLALFDRYIAHLERLDDATRDPLPPGAVDPRAAVHVFLQRRQAAEIDDFGAAAAARLFCDADRLAAALLDGDDSALPPATRAARAATVAPTQVAAEVAARRSAGASDAEVWQLRAARFGADAADRLAALDARRRH
jgi:lipase chaperone LimK